MTSIYFQDYTTNFQIVFIDLSLFFRSHFETSYDISMFYGSSEHILQVENYKKSISSWKI